MSRSETLKAIDLAARRARGVCSLARESRLFNVCDGQEAVAIGCGTALAFRIGPDLGRLLQLSQSLQLFVGQIRPGILDRDQVFASDLGTRESSNVSQHQVGREVILDALFFLFFFCFQFSVFVVDQGMSVFGEGKQTSKQNS